MAVVAPAIERFDEMPQLDIARSTSSRSSSSVFTLPPSLSIFHGSPMRKKMEEGKDNGRGKNLAPPMVKRR